MHCARPGGDHSRPRFPPRWAGVRASPRAAYRFMQIDSLKIGLLAPPGRRSAAYLRRHGVDGLSTRPRVTAAGHEVVLYATGDSTAPVAILYGSASACWDRLGHGAMELRGYESLAGCDVVHDHTLLGPAWALAAGCERVVTTCRGPLDGELRAIYRRYGKRMPVIAISHDQAYVRPTSPSTV